MKSSYVCEVEIEEYKKSDLVKYGMVGWSIPIGLIVSCVLACLNIDLDLLLATFSDNISNPELANMLFRVMKKWYVCSGIALLISVILFVGYQIISKYMKKKQEKDTWGEAIFFSIEVILLTQVVLPLFSLPVGVVIALLYLVYYSSILMKSFIGFGTYLFILVVEKIFKSSGISLTYDEFIGQEKYTAFLTLITFFILIPYLLSFMLRGIKRLIQKCTGSQIIGYIFKPVENIFSVDILRYGIYLVLFFTSVYTYSMNIDNNDYVLMMIKEALLEFVLLDTVFYAIYSKISDRRKSKELLKLREYYEPIKYDLEFISSAITMCNVKGKQIRARVNFSDKLNKSIERKHKEVGRVDALLADISNNFYEIEVLEVKIHDVLEEILKMTR